MQTHPHNSQNAKFLPITRFDTFAPLKESLNRLIVADGGSEDKDGLNRNLPRSGTGEESPPPQRAIVGFMETMQAMPPWQWSPMSLQKRKLTGAYVDEDGHNLCLQDMYGRGLFGPRLQLPAAPSPSALTMRYPNTLLRYQENAGYALPPFACCEASLWRGRSEGLLAAAGRPGRDGAQPIVIHNETSARLQNEVVQECVPQDAPEVPERPGPTYYGRLMQSMIGFFHSPLNLFAVGSLTAIVAYCSIRYLCVRQQQLAFRRQHLLIRRNAEKTTPGALLTQLLMKAAGPRRRLYSPWQRWPYNPHEFS